MILILCVCVFWLQVCVCTVRVPGAWQRPEEGVGSTETGVRELVSPWVGARNIRWALWKSSQSSQLLSCLFLEIGQVPEHHLEDW